MSAHEKSAEAIREIRKVRELEASAYITADEAESQIAAIKAAALKG